MHNTTISKISTVHPTPFNGCKRIQSALMISVANVIGDHAAEQRPREVQITPVAQKTIFMKNIYAVYPNQHFPSPWEQHIHCNAVPAPYLTMPMDSSHTSSQSSELLLALPALSSFSTVSTTALASLKKSRSNNRHSRLNLAQTNRPGGSWQLQSLPSQFSSWPKYQFQFCHIASNG
uniref:Uncharacterized protein n=1 Tax=Romanomermis culicivorax TaxID=13658 RepID=A0A915IL28_ROMCU